MREGLLKIVQKSTLLVLVFATLAGCAHSPSQPAANPIRRADMATPAPFPPKSIYQTEATWTTDQSREIKLRALAGRPQVLVMFFIHCQFACPIVVNDMRRIDGGAARASSQPGRFHARFLRRRSRHAPSAG